MNTSLQAHPDIVKAAQLRVQAIELRTGGATYVQIAQELQISVATAHSYVNKGMAALNATSAELQREMRNIHLARLEEMFRTLWPKREDSKIAMAMVRILDRQSKLLGLDMPVKIHHLHDDVEPPQSIDLKKLTLEQILQLESILTTGQVAQRVETPPQDPSLNETTRQEHLSPSMAIQGVEQPQGRNSDERVARAETVVERSGTDGVEQSLDSILDGDR